MNIKHIVLAGDSIFDNDSYVLADPVMRARPSGLPLQQKARPCWSNAHGM